VSDSRIFLWRRRFLTARPSPASHFSHRPTPPLLPYRSGYVTSDCDADSDVFFSHHYTATPEEAVAAIAKAGTDADCGGFMTKYAPSAIANGTVTEAQLDVLLTRLFMMRIRLGHFNGATALQSIGPADVCNAYALELARDGVRQSAVLAKNTGGLLPLAAGAFKNVLVVGPNVNLSDTTNYYGGRPCADPNNNGQPMAYTVYDAIKQHVPGVVSLLGTPSVGSNDTSGVAAAAAAAAAAALVVLAIGSDLSLEREGHDRTSIAFSAGQLALIAAVAAAAKGPVVALVLSGGAMDVTPLLANAQVGAVLLLGQPSIQVVGAGDVVFGRTLDGRPVAPAGRMSQMTYPADYVNQVSLFDFGMRPGPSAWPPGTNPGRTYRFYTGVPVLPFGFGLSFTTWTYTPLPDPQPPVRLAAVEAAALAHAASGVLGHIPAGLKAEAAQFWVNVTNTGAVDSDDVVLGFLVPPGAGANGVPLQELFGFERVFVPAGQTVTVYLGAQGVRFTQAGEDGVRRVLKGEYTVRFGVKETAAGGMGFAERKFIAQ
jgi:beta-D-xylosidase 4